MRRTVVADSPRPPNSTVIASVWRGRSQMNSDSPHASGAEGGECAPSTASGAAAVVTAR